MAALEQPPRYNESFSEFEVPSYSASLQQLQNLPPPISEEPSLMDAPTHQTPSYAYELRPSSSAMSSSDLTPPPYEQALGDEPVVDNQASVNNNMAQNGFAGYPNGEVEDKIKDILSRYNPHAENIPKMEDPFPAPPQTQPTRQPQQMPRQQQPQAQPPQAHSQPLYQPPQQPTQYQAPQQIHSYQPQQEQLRARVVQNLPSQQLQSPPPVQKFQQQMPVHQQPTSPVVQMHRPAPQIQQQPVQQPVQQTMAMPQYPQQPQSHQMPQPMPQQAPQQAPQQIPQQIPQQMPQQISQLQQLQQQQQLAQQMAQLQQLQQQQQMAQQMPQVAPQPQQLNQTDLSYVQLIQQQAAVQLQMQTQQIQQLQTYFDKITAFMEKTEKRIANLETTAQGILKNQKQDDLSSVVSSSELETLKRMQHQMESDFDVAKRLQAEFEKEKRKEEKRRSKSSSSTSSPSSSRSKDKRDSKSSTSSSSSSMQECPICTLKVPFAELELHVNQCLEGIERTDTKADPVVQEKASFWKRVFGPGPKKDKEEPNNQIVPAAKPPTARPALPAPVATSSLGQPPMYPNAQDFYQVPFVYRGGYPQPQMMPYGYPQPQQIYYYPPNMAQPNTQAKK